MSKQYAPQAFLPYLLPEAEARRQNEPLDPASILSGLPEGQRDYGIFRYASRLRGKGMSFEEAEVLDLGAAACRPPFPPNEAMAKLRSAWKYEVGTATDQIIEELLADPNGAFEPEAIGALAVLMDKKPAKYAAVKKGLKGKVNLVDLERAVRHQAKSNRRLRLVEPGETEAEETSLPAVYDGLRKRLENAGPYTLNNAGYLCHRKYSERGGEVDISVANFVPLPMWEITRDDGREQTKTFEIEGIMAIGRPLPPVSIPAREFPSMSWIYPAWGMGPAIEPGRGCVDLVRHCIVCLGRDVPRKVFYTHLGWRDMDGKWVYIHAGGAVGDENATVEPGEGLHRYILPDRADHEAMTVSIELMGAASAEITVPLWAAVYLAPLCEPLRKAGIEPAFIEWVYGQSGARKSSLVAVFLSHFGVFDAKNLPGSFKDTGNALEKRGFLAKDTLMVVDDFHPAANSQDANKMRRTAQGLLRAHGDRVGRNRMRADTSIREGFPPRGLCIITGEDLPDAGQSTTARFLTVEVDQGDVELDELGRFQETSDQLASAMRGYIEWLAPQLDELPDKLKEQFKSYRQKAMVEGQHGRLPETVAWLYMGFRAGLDFAADIGVCTEENRDGAMETAWSVLTRLAENQGKRIKEDRPVVKFLDIVRELLASGKCNVVHVITVGDSPTPMESGFIGWYDADWAYLLPESVFREVAHFSQAQGGHFPVTAKTLWKHLEEEELIFVHKEGNEIRRIIQKKIGDKNQRVLWIKPEAIGLDTTVIRSAPEQRSRARFTPSTTGTANHDMF